MQGEISFHKQLPCGLIPKNILAVE